MPRPRGRAESRADEAAMEEPMKTTGTKKSPTPTPAKVTGAELPKGTPKGSDSRVAPALEERIGSLERIVDRMERLLALLGEAILRGVSEPLATDAVIEVLGDREDTTSRKAGDVLFHAKRRKANR